MYISDYMIAEEIKNSTLNFSAISMKLLDNYFENALHVLSLTLDDLWRIYVTKP